MTIPDKSPDRITPGKPAETVGPTVTPGQAPEGFESYMHGTPQANVPPGTPQATGSPTPANVPQGPAISTSGISFNTLLAQATTTQDSLGTVEQQLNDQNLRLRRSQSHLVRQKLGDASSYIRAANSKLGLEPGESKMPPGLSGISRFIAMVNDGQDQLSQAQQQLSKMASSGAQMTPGDMMSVQVKMALAQQEIDYTSTLLSKVIQSITQIINTQL